MAETDYRVVLEKMKQDLILEQAALGRCLQEQEHHERKITGLRAAISSIAKMMGEEFIEEDAIGFTDAIRAAFQSVGKDGRLAPTDVKERLAMMGYDLSKYGNAMASVHTIINRLESKGEIKRVGSRSDGKPLYQIVKQFVIEGLSMTPTPADTKELKHDFKPGTYMETTDTKKKD